MVVDVTIVVAVKVYDGVVLAADSATAISLLDKPGGKVVGHQVWNRADKVFQIHRDLPIGLATWGMGQIGPASISTLAKDLRRRLMGRDPTHADWELVKETYQLSAVADRLVELMHDELFSKVSVPAGSEGPGFFLVGYSGSSTQPEGWMIQLKSPSQRPTADKLWDLDDFGWRAFGQPDAIGRLLNGYTTNLENALKALMPNTKHADLTKALATEAKSMVVPSMPFADAIDLARFCAEVTVGYTRFSPGADLVGGPIDIAGISRHEGFKWIQRKHYYPADLNPRRPHDHDQ